MKDASQSAVLIHAEGRRVTWFELFFDLVFVVAVATLAQALSHHYDWAGLTEFGFLFFVLWWLWLGHTFQSSRFDEDRPDQWGIGFAQVLAVVFIAYGASDAVGGRGWAFAGGVAAFKALLMVGYLREIRRPGLSRLCTIYGTIYGLQAMLWAGSIWAGSIWAGPTLRPVLWALALLIDIATPFLVARETHRAPPHPEHLPERFGLFTIILLGETAAAAVHALDHGPALHGDTLAVAIMGAGLGFLYWLGYFRRARGGAERHIRDAAAGRSLRLWAYGHMPLYLGLASLGAGTVHLAHYTDLAGPAPWVFALSAALSMMGVTLVSLATHGRPIRTGWPHVLTALMALAIPILAPTAPVLIGGILALASGQIALSMALARANRISDASS